MNRKEVKKISKNLVLFVAFLYVTMGVAIFFLYCFRRNVDLKTTLTFFGSMALMFVSFSLVLYSVSGKVCQSLKLLMVDAVCILISFLLVQLISRTFSLYLAPFALCALLVSLLVHARIGFVSNLMVVICHVLAEITFREAVISKEILVFTIINGVVVSMIAAFAGSKHLRRLHYVITAIALGVVTLANGLVNRFMFQIETLPLTTMATNAFFSGPVDVMLFFLLSPVMERVFNLVTDFRLAELSNTNQPLLRKLLDTAPGTFNHSLMVANYAEACASALNENPYLARAAGYYHDIGKMKNPSYFTENQVDGYNPHNEITPEISVSFIKKHTINGYVMAQEHHLPQEICDIIIEHHGTMPVKYFYLKAQKYAEEEISATEYSYSGPKPHTKMAAILMICDACEAALRTLQRDEKSKAEALIKNIIRERLTYGQFDDCPITMEELSTIGSVISTTYLGVAHERIRYQDQKKMETEDEN